jgi:hypothetical protein
MQLSHDINGKLVPAPLVGTKVKGAQVPYIKWYTHAHNLCTSSCILKSSLDYIQFLIQSKGYVNAYFLYYLGNGNKKKIVGMCLVEMPSWWG